MSKIYVQIYICMCVCVAMGIYTNVSDQPLVYADHNKCTANKAYINNNNNNNQYRWNMWNWPIKPLYATSDCHSSACLVHCITDMPAILHRWRHSAHTHIHARYHIDLPATLLHCCNMQHANIFAHLIESFVNIFPICVIIERDMQCTLHTHVHTYIYMQLRRLLAASAAVAPLWLPPGANALKATIRVWF